MSADDEWRAYQAGARKLMERSLEIAGNGITLDDIYDLDPKAHLHLGPRTMKRAFVISPYSGDTARNVKFANRCMTYCLQSGFAPFAGHILYAASGLLNDNDPKDRDFGMHAAYEYLRVSDVAFCFMDLGVSSGMRVDCDAARRLKIKIDYVTVDGSFPTVDAIHNLELPHAHMPCALCQIESEKPSAT